MHRWGEKNDVLERLACWRKMSVIAFHGVVGVCIGDGNNAGESVEKNELHALHGVMEKIDVNITFMYFKYFVIVLCEV